MKKTILTAIVFFLCIFLCDAQNLRGGFGHAYFGTAFNLSPNIQSDLEVSSLLGKDLQLNRLAKFGGGGGYGLFAGRILLGGSGFGYEVSDGTVRGQATVTMGGGFVNLGYLVTVKDNLLSFPYIGVGGNGMKLKLKNNTSDESFTIGSKTIAPGSTMNFQAGGISFEAGYAVKFLTFSTNEPGSHGGLMIGLQAGTYLFTGISDWHEERSDDMIPTFSTAYAFSPYLRITIGGGGFKSVDDE